MKINKNYLRLTKVSLCICLGSTIANAQTTEHHYTAASDSNDAWTNNANWDTNRPDGPEIRAIFGELDKPEVDRVNINFGSNLLLTPNVLEVGSLRFLDSFNTEASPFLIRNSNTASYGTLKLYGIETSIDGKSENVLIENYADQNIRFSPTNAGYEIELNNSGIIHQDGAGILYLRTALTEAGGSHSITKTGSGILQLDRRNADFGADQSTYSGGFTLAEGTVQFSHSGTVSANPFGTGPMTLQGGTLRSTTDTGRTLRNDVILDGGAAFGSTEEGKTGRITLNSSSGAISTTLVSDSTLTVHNEVIWHQATSGDHSLRKEGAGVLELRGTGGDIAHTGATIAAAGTLVIDGNVTGSDVEVFENATLQGTGSFNESVAIRSGGTLGFGFEESGRMTIFGNLEMEADSTIFFNLENNSSFDSLLSHGQIDFGNGSGDVNLEIGLGFEPTIGDVFLLVDNQSADAIDGFLSYDGLTLAEGSNFIVNDGGFSQEFIISYLAGDSGNSIELTAIPEPSTWSLLGGTAVLGAALLRRRTRKT